jgi:hypothetical protein
MQGRSPSKFRRQLQLLVRHEVEFIVVGGVAAVLGGAPILTLDLDIVYRRSPENVRRLATALREVNAIYNDPVGRRIIPDVSKLESVRLNLLITDLGKLDVLYSISNGLTYDDLFERSSDYDFEGMCLRVLDLEAVIEAKAIADREKDRAVLPILRRTLELKKSSGSA